MWAQRGCRLITQFTLQLAFQWKIDFGLVRNTEKRSGFFLTLKNEVAFLLFIETRTEKRDIIFLFIAY